MGSPSSCSSADEGNHLSQTKDGFKQARSTLKTCQGREIGPSSVLSFIHPCGTTARRGPCSQFFSKGVNF